MAGCNECGGAGFVVVCIDDLCRGAGECMHGDGEVACSCESDDLDFEDDEPMSRCGCKYCPCVSETEYGEPCAHCLDGAHQG